MVIDKTDCVVGRFLMKKCGKDAKGSIEDAGGPAAASFPDLAAIGFFFVTEVSKAFPDADVSSLRGTFPPPAPAPAAKKKAPKRVAAQALSMYEVDTRGCVQTAIARLRARGFDVGSTVGEGQASSMWQIAKAVDGSEPGLVLSLICQSSSHIAALEAWDDSAKT